MSAATDCPLPTGKRIPSLEELADCETLAPGIYIIRRFAQTELGISNPETYLEEFKRTVPHAAVGEPLPMFKPVIVTGDNDFLRMRGNAIGRNKCVAQDPAPDVAGFVRKYSYTGTTFSLAIIPSQVTLYGRVAIRFHSRDIGCGRDASHKRTLLSLQSVREQAWRSRSQSRDCDDVRKRRSWHWLAFGQAADIVSCQLDHCSQVRRFS